MEMDYAPRRILIPENAVKMPVITVLPHHIDTNRHVNNAQYVAIAREALPEDIRIRELRVEYKKAAVQGDEMIPCISREGSDYTVALCDREGTAYAVVWMKAESEGPRL